MQELIALYDDEIEQARTEHREFMEVIQAVEDDNLREVLTLYHINGLTWEQVADRTWYSYRTTLDHYQKALTAVYAVLCDKDVRGFGQG